MNIKMDDKIHEIKITINKEKKNRIWGYKIIHKEGISIKMYNYNTFST